MPKLSVHKQAHSNKMLMIGDSGSGKTGALISLIEAGYKLVILDFDNGLDILVNAILEEPNADELLERVTYATLTDKMKAVNGVLMPDGVPKAFSTAMKLLTNWKTEDEDLGPVSTWDDDTILVVDSLTFMSNAAFRYVDAINNFKDPRQTFGESMKLIESALGLLYSDSIKCHVIINSHITYIENEANVNKGYPSSIGKALSPKIPRYFNSILQVKVIGAGASAKRVIRTVPDGTIDLKAPMMPGKIPQELPLATGLADFFKLLHKQEATKEK
jgi:hypothetical protein